MSISATLSDTTEGFRLLNRPTRVAFANHKCKYVFSRRSLPYEQRECNNDDEYPPGYPAVPEGMDHPYRASTCFMDVVMLRGIRDACNCTIADDVSESDVKCKLPSVFNSNFL